MREQIAVLDGVPGYMASDNAGHEVVAGNGQNRSGGSDWFPGGTYMPSSEGLASGLSTGLEIERVPGYTPSDNRGYDVVAGNGQNRSGGSDWFPGGTTMPSAEGLAGSLSIDAVPGYGGRQRVIEPGAGQNYTGGSDWFPGAPTMPSSSGLVGLRGAGNVRAWAACGVRNVIALIGVSRASSDVETVVNAFMHMGFPRRVALSPQSVGFMAAFYTARRVSVPMARARQLAMRASQMCG